ncbi:MAG TPA: F0F1 ATP synthase subunit gamma, partial [Thermoanaerobaculia bacterium]|nr:F0F1 ATP synthase subunit gamma [Thermoanaerobaculia bacterium]
MPSLIDIRRRLRSVKSTQQITKAMKMVAAAKLRRAQDRVVGARPYAAQLSHVLASVMAEAGAAQQPLLVEREEKKVIVVVVAGDRGLCGAFNTNVHRATRQLLISHPGWTDVRILPIGRKAVEFWRRSRYTLTEKT